MLGGGHWLWQLLPCPGAQAVLAQALGVLGVVRKQRLLYLVGQTRVHLDTVEGLGDFVELEVSGGAQPGHGCQPRRKPGCLP